MAAAPVSTLVLPVHPFRERNRPAGSKLTVSLTEGDSGITGFQKYMVFGSVRLRTVCDFTDTAHTRRTAPWEFISKECDTLSGPLDGNPHAGPFIRGPNFPCLHDPSCGLQVSLSTIRPPYRTPDSGTRDVSIRFNQQHPKRSFMINKSPLLTWETSLIRHSSKCLRRGALRVNITQAIMLSSPGAGWCLPRSGIFACEIN